MPAAFSARTAGISGIGKGLDAGEVGGVELHGAGGDLGHLEPGNGLAQVHVAAGDDALGPALAR